MLHSPRSARVFLPSACRPTAVRRPRDWRGSLALSWALALALSLPLAAAAEPETVTERTVVTQDGAMYRGEVREYIVGDHITLKLDTGESHRIAWSDAVQISPPRTRPKGPSAVDLPRPPIDRPPPSDPPPSRPPTIVNNQPVPTPVEPNTERTVVTQDGGSYNGEVVEFESGSHILLRLATGESRRIPWAEAKRISPPHLRGNHDPSASPERTVVMPDGTTIRGDLVETRLGEYTILKLQSGQIRRIAWRDVKRIMVPNPTGRPSTIPISGELLVVLDTGKRVQGEYFEYVADDHLVLRHAAGGFRIIPVGSIRKITLLAEGSQ